MDVDFAALVPHIPVRIYVMGDRGTRREPANPNDIHRMAEIVREGLEAGAVGFTTSRAAGHRTASGDVAPSTTAGEDELLGIAMAMKAAGKGMIHTASEFGDVTYGQSMEFNMWRRIAEASGRPTSFPLLQQNDNPARWELIAQACADARAAGVKMTGQVVARPVGVLYALELTSNPFSGCASYKAIAHLPLAERVKAMRDPEVRARILSEDAYLSDARVLRMTREVANMYRMGDPPNYSPPLDQRFDHLAKAQGVTPFEIAYDVLLENDGHAIIYQPATNYSHHNLDAVLAMMKRPDTIMGIADGGAHLGRICDASTPTHMLTYWTRDRQGERLSVPWVVKALSSETAAYIGFNDRGLIKVGYKADLNVIDYDNLTLHAPHPSYDLPAGGMRLTQSADGYTATIVSGVVTYRDGQATGALPGKLVRGEQPAPTVKVAAKPEVVMA
jgi:N-acyl-D-aspartate/D-glutamate deacylase